MRLSTTLGAVLLILVGACTGSATDHSVAPAANQTSSQNIGASSAFMAPKGTPRTIDFTTTEGTLMSVDVLPDGKWIVFDLLGHIYRLPAGGGQAECLTQDSGIALNYHPRFLARWTADCLHLGSSRAGKCVDHAGRRNRAPPALPGRGTSLFDSCLDKRWAIGPGDPLRCDSRSGLASPQRLDLAVAVAWCAATFADRHTETVLHLLDEPRRAYRIHFFLLDGAQGRFDLRGGFQASVLGSYNPTTH